MNRTRDRVDELIEYPPRSGTPFLPSLPDHHVEFDIRGLPRPKSNLSRACQVDYDDGIGAVCTKVVDSANGGPVTISGIAP